jgi:hypothetical protein
VDIHSLINIKEKTIEDQKMKRDLKFVDLQNVNQLKQMNVQKLDLKKKKEKKQRKKNYSSPIVLNKNTRLQLGPTRSIGNSKKLFKQSVFLQLPIDVVVKWVVWGNPPPLVLHYGIVNSRRLFAGPTSNLSNQCRQHSPTNQATTPSLPLQTPHLHL